MTFIDVSVSTQGSPEGRGGAKWTAGAARWSAAAGPVAREAIRKKAPVGKTYGPGKKVTRGGALKKSINDRSSSSSGVARVEIVTNAPYAKYLATGTRPHPIWASNGGRLHFWTPDGAEHFRTSVYHPGMRPNPFVQKAMKRALPAIRTSFAEIMHETFGGAP